MLFATSNVISPQFLDVLNTAGATGFHPFPVRLVRGASDLMVYHGLQITGRGGPFDPYRSSADIRDGALFGHAAIYMVESKWDQSDLFFVPGLGIMLFCSERIGNMLRRARLPNVSLVDASQFSTG